MTYPHTFTRHNSRDSVCRDCGMIERTAYIKYIATEECAVASEKAEALQAKAISPHTFAKKSKTQSRCTACGLVEKTVYIKYILNEECARAAAKAKAAAAQKAEPKPARTARVWTDSRGDRRTDYWTRRSEFSGYDYKSAGYDPRYDA